jgi:hypothetical protein
MNAEREREPHQSNSPALGAGEASCDRIKKGKRRAFREPIKGDIAAWGPRQICVDGALPQDPLSRPSTKSRPPQLEGNMRVAQFIIESAVAPTKISKCGSEEPMR